jgi:predicted dehydrogenase
LLQELGVCLIGCGNVSVPHLNAYVELPYVKIVGCCDLNEDLAKKRATQYGFNRVYADYREALSDKNVDFVDICVPAWLHSKIATEAMEAGKHVLCEKPMATSISDANKMIMISKKTKCKIMIAQSTRYIPLFSEAKKQVDANKIGKPVLIRFATRWFNPILQWKTTEGRKKYESQKVGHIVDAGIHSFDYMRWVFGKEPVSVYAEVDTYPEPMPLFTQMNIALEFGDELGFIELSRTTKGYPSYDRVLDIIGTEGKISGMDNSVWTHAKHPSTLKVKIASTPTAYLPLIENIPYPSEYKLEIADFLKSLFEDKAVPIPPEDSKAALALALAAEKSAKTGRLVEFY